MRQCGRSAPRHRFSAGVAGVVDPSAGHFDARTSAGIIRPRRARDGIGTERAVTATPCDENIVARDRVNLQADHRPIGMPGTARLWSPTSPPPRTISPRTTLPLTTLTVPRIGTTDFALDSIRRTARANILDCAMWAGLSGLAGIIFSHYTSAGHSLAAIGVELDTIAAVVIGSTLFSGSHSFLLGTYLDMLTWGFVQIHITFDGMLSSGRTEIVVGLLLFALILLPRILGNLPARRAAGARGSVR